MSAVVQSSQPSAQPSKQAMVGGSVNKSNGSSSSSSNGSSFNSNVASSTPSTSSSKPIQWATSTGATVLQQLAATREQQQKLKGSKLTSNDLINSKPSNSTSSATSAAKKAQKQVTASASSSSKTKSASANTVPASMPRMSPSTSNKKLPTEKSASVKPDMGSEQDTAEKAIDKKPARRRKANRACSHCQKAHLTCEDQRPCERCIKKGLADSCTDGARKKAKYLLDDDELLELKREKERKARGVSGEAQGNQGVREQSDSVDPPNTSFTADQSTVSDASQPASWDSGAAAAAAAAAANMGITGYGVLAPSSLEPLAGHSDSVPSAPSQHTDADLYGHLPSSFSPSSAASGVKNAFDSENASLEYSILSSMLNGIDPSWLSGSPDQQNGAEADVGNVLNPGAFSHMGIDSMPWQFSTPQQQHQQQQQQSISSMSWKDALRPNAQQAVEPLHHLDASLMMGGGATPGGEEGAAYDALEVPSPKPAVAAGISPLDAKPRNGSLALTDTSEQDAQKSKAAAAAAAAGLDHKPDAVWRERVKHIYGDTTRPFPYTEGYHFLIKYVTANLDKADVLRIVRALAIFRPSLIALQMPLTEDDEIFVERSIQRTILEFEKLISFSGTPTVVWRRTCEIVVVGAEFSMLTQWSKDYVMGRYIYEFFEKPSILDYWEKFALHAFENTAQSIMMPVTLKTSAGTTTRCAACFSIKRDIFDLPSLIVGNFLPILG